MIIYFIFAENNYSRN